jgi:epoxide hydrolase-like predicted phosphatase
MKNKISAIIFDMGGVLLRTVSSIPREEMALRFNTNRSELENFVFHSDSSVLSELGEIEDTEHWKRVLMHFNQPTDDPLNAYYEYFSGDRMDGDLLEYISVLRREYRVGLLSNAWKNARSRLDGLFQFIHYFDEAVFSAEVGCRKPEKKIYKIMLQLLKVDVSEVVFIDDFPANVEGAESFGIKSILFKDPVILKDQLNNMLS